MSGDLLKRLAGSPAAHDLIYASALHLGIEHLQGSAAGVDLVIMSEIREPFEDPEQVLVPGTVQDLYVAAAALRAERSEPRELVATLGVETVQLFTMEEAMTAVTKAAQVQKTYKPPTAG